MARRSGFAASYVLNQTDGDTRAGWIAGVSVGRFWEAFAQMELEAVMNQVEGRFSALATRSMRVLTVCCVGLAALCGGTSRSLAQYTYTLTPVKNSYTWEAQPTTAEGANNNPALELKYDNSGGNYRQIYLRFAVPVVPAVSTVTVQMYGGYANNTDSVPVDVYPLTSGDTDPTGSQLAWDSWLESNLTWDNAPPLKTSPPPTQMSSPVPSVTNTQKYWQWVISSYMSSNLSTLSGQDFDMVFEATAEAATSSVATFNSDHNTGGNGPELLLTVPLPGAPAGLNVTNIVAAPPSLASETGMSLSWNAGAGSPYLGTSYTLFRSTTHAFTPVVCVSNNNPVGCNSIASGLTATTYTDSGLLANTTYYYQVQWAYTLSGTSTTLYSASSNENHNTTYASVAPTVAILIDPVFQGNTIPSPVLLAVADLQRDLKNVLGQASVICTGNIEANCTNYATSSIIVITGSESSTVHGTLPYNSGLTGMEVHSLSTVAAASGDPAGTPQRVVLQGSDTLGTIYAIYEFSQDYLGVPPLWYWTGWTPPTTAWTSAPVPSNLSTTFNAPAVAYRGIYPGDDEMLVPWLSVTTIAEPWMGTTTNYDAYFETMLRLKFNLVDVGNITDMPYVDGEPSYTSTKDKWAITCAQRGMLVTFTHTDPFGASFSDWNNYWSTPQLGNYAGCQSNGTGCPAASITTTANPNGQAQLEQFWKHYITVAQALETTYGLQVMETLAFRGNGDEPWWAYVAGDPDGTAGGDPVFEASQITTELNDQLGYMQGMMGTNQLARIILYDENQDFLANSLNGTDGFSHSTYAPPTSASDSNLIWSFTNEQRDHVPGPDALVYKASSYNTAGQKVGYYMNPEYESTGAHITSDEGPWKLENNYRYVMGQAPAGNFAVSILNLGNFREFTLDASAAANLLWNGTTTYTTDSFITNTFAPMYFASGNAATIDSLYSSYYSDILEQKAPNFPTNSYASFPTEYVFQDLRYYQGALVLFNNLTNECYNVVVTGTCTGVVPPAPFVDRAGSYEPEEGYPPVGSVFYNIDSNYIDPGNTTNTITAMMTATGAAATTFTNLYTSCSATEGTLTTAPQQNYFIDSLCSNVQIMEGLNNFMYHLLKADSQMTTPATPNPNIVTTLNTAQTNLTAISNAIGTRYTGESFGTWYSNSTEFDIPTLQTDLCAALKQYGSTATCP